MQRWVDELKTCESEESFLTTYQSFLDTTWEALANRVPSSGTFPFIQPTPQELSMAYYMKSRALILHNRIVWGPDADKDNPKPPSKQQESTVRPSQEGASEGGGLIDASVPPSEGIGDDEDPNRKKPDDTSQSKGDESQDPEKKKEEKEASVDQPQSSAEKEAQDKIDDLMQKLQEARDAKAKAEREAQEAVQRAAEERARKIGEELIQEVETEEAAKQRKQKASEEKKAKKKKKKTSPKVEGESEPSEGEEDTPEAISQKKRNQKRMIRLRMNPRKRSRKRRSLLKTSPRRMMRIRRVQLGMKNLRNHGSRWLKELQNRDRILLKRQRRLEHALILDQCVRQLHR